jgi:hypothetical protein
MSFLCGALHIIRVLGGIILPPYAYYCAILGDVDWVAWIATSCTNFN